MVADGRGLLDAITPLMGPPWQIPMEMPLFQWLAAQLSFSWLDFADAGRTLSLATFLLSVAVLRRLAIDLDLEPRVANASAALFASSPIFLAYAYSFTIESLATLLGMLSLWAFVRWLRDLSITILVFSIVTGVAAVLAKATTWVVFAAALAAIAVWALAAARRHGRSMWDTAVGSALALGIPLACGLAWVRWSDAIKSENPLTAGLTSAALADWNYGAPELRLSATAWALIVLRATILVVGPIGLAAALPAGILAVRSLKARPPFPVLIASIAALAAGPMVFFNLYLRHDYYVLAGGAFAVLLLASVLFARRPRPIVLTLIIASNLVTTGLFLAVKQANYADPLSDSLVRTVRDLPEGQTLIVFGSYLDARIPYEAKRKALQTRLDDANDPALREVVSRMANERVGAILVRSGAFLPAARRTASRLGCDGGEGARSPACGSSTRATSKQTLDLRPIDLEGEAAARLVGFSPIRQGRWGVLLPSGDEAKPGLGFRRRGNTYLFDIERGLRVIHRRWSPVGRGG